MRERDLCHDDGEGTDLKSLRKDFSDGSVIVEEWGLRYVEECMGTSSVGRPRKKWIDSLTGCLEKKKFEC